MEKMQGTGRITEMIKGEMTMKNRISNRKWRAALVILLLLCVSLSGCSWIDSKIHEFKGSLIGNTYTIDTFDNFGRKIMTTSGKKVNVEGNYVNATEDSKGELTSVLTINIDGEQMTASGNTMIFFEKGLEPEYDWSIQQVDGNGNPLDVTDNTLIAGKINAIRNKFGKPRVVVIESQLGLPIYAFSGDKVYWEIPDDLPKFTRIIVDGRSLYIHRANFQIIDLVLLDD